MTNRLSGYIVMALLILSMAPASFAGCDKGIIDRLNFALDNAPTNFSAIVGSQRGDTTQYDSPGAEAFCPRTYILNHYPATKDRPESWFVKFSWHYTTGTLDDVTAAVIKQFNPVLIAKGYQDKPDIKEGELKGYLLEWDGVNDDTWITVETYVDRFSDDSTVWLALRVGHNGKPKVKAK